MTNEEKEARQGAWTWTGSEFLAAFTGDLEPHTGLRSPSLAQEVPGDRQYLGWSAGSTLVGANRSKH